MLKSELSDEGVYTGSILSDGVKKLDSYFALVCDTPAYWFGLGELLSHCVQMCDFLYMWTAFCPASKLYFVGIQYDVSSGQLEDLKDRLLREVSTLISSLYFKTKIPSSYSLYTLNPEPLLDQLCLLHILVIWSLP